MDSILTSIKKLLMIAEDYEHFDTDIIIHINSAFSTLHQLGVGPKDSAFKIYDKSETWDMFLEYKEDIESVKTYIFLKVKLAFDPPTAGFTLTAYENQIKELEWRLNVVDDNTYFNNDPEESDGSGFEFATDEEVDSIMTSIFGL